MNKVLGLLAVVAAAQMPFSSGAEPSLATPLGSA